jgi:acetyltransferase-like isoleucine patch superfamily enzyme
VVQFLKEAFRSLYYHPHGMKMGKSSIIDRPRWILNPHRIEIGEKTSILRHSRLEVYVRHAGGHANGHIIIGNDVYIGCYAMICALDSITIGDGCVLSDRVFIEDCSHGTDPDGPPIMERPLESKGPIKIGNRCFIGIGSAILSGVTLGDNCIVGSLSVVTKSFPAYSMVAGSPARLIKRFDPLSKQWIPVKN